ncbi:hypothetical protein [Polluticoccus soli]|uniref:hypothetical protein n=1 Tax=Polluticoccus soli TaxID=3034150 RepID=UPI0023E100B4|nr:hypothetical protein [Flavipsychrobacter sp. JY13-12]
MVHLDFPISAEGVISGAFKSVQAATFGDACNYITNLPYGRNADKNNLLSVFSDGCGTCSTKHALLFKLAEENGIKGLKLTMGIYKMNALNSSPVAKVLEQHGLEYIPEAHNYLRYGNEVIDCTARKPLNFLPDLLEETEIRPDQITDFKVIYHKGYLDQWRLETGSKYSLDELWTIREACIAALAGI